MDNELVRVEEPELPAGRKQLTAQEEYEEVKAWALERQTKTLQAYLKQLNESVSRAQLAIKAVIEVLAEKS